MTPFELTLITGSFGLLLAGIGAAVAIAYRLGVSNEKINALREWREVQQREAQDLKLVTARLAEGHVGVVETLAFMRGMLSRRTPDDNILDIEGKGG